VILNVHLSVVFVLFILEYMCLHRDINVHVTVVLVVFILEYLYLPLDLNVHVSVVLVFFIVEDRCLHCDFKCTYISGVSDVHSGVPVLKT
jgi:hypothetical protein